MANNIIAFPSNGQLPAYLQKAKSAVSFAAFYSGVAPSFDVLSIKGKGFALIRNGERQVIPDPADPDEPARALNLVLLNANPAVSRIYYEAEWEDGQSDKPDCFSNDGVAPASDAQTAQSKTCAACPHAVWGTGGQGKGTKCRINRRVAVAAAGDPGKAMLLRVPTASLKNLAEYAGWIEGRGVPMEAVITKVRFDPEEATPKLLFKSVGLLDEAGYKTSAGAALSSEVKQIIGVAAGPTDAPAEPKVTVTEDEVAAAMGAAAADDDEPAPKPKPKKISKPKAEPSPLAAADDDDEDEEPAPKPKKVSKPKAEPNDAEDELAAKVDSLLDDFDD